MGYLVEIWHYRPAYRKGDLEDESVIIQNQTFKLRKDAKDFIENKLAGKKNAKRDYHRGDKNSTCYYYTGKTWIHENSGEECRECYTFILKKV